MYRTVDVYKIRNFQRFVKRRVNIKDPRQILLFKYHATTISIRKIITFREAFNLCAQQLIQMFYLSLLRFNALDETRLRVGKIDRGQRLEIFQTG